MLECTLAFVPMIEGLKLEVKDDYPRVDANTRRNPCQS